MRVCLLSDLVNHRHRRTLYALLGTGAGSSKVLKVEPGVSSSTPSYSTTGTGTTTGTGQSSGGSSGSGGARTPIPSDQEGTPISSHEHQAHHNTPRPLQSPQHQNREGKFPPGPVSIAHLSTDSPQCTPCRSTLFIDSVLLLICINRRFRAHRSPFTSLHAHVEHSYSEEHYLRKSPVHIDGPLHGSEGTVEPIPTPGRH